MENEIIEKLAKLEHNQWRTWVASFIKKYNIPEELVDRWMASMIPYDALSEGQKEKDRVWARKVASILGDEVEELRNPVRGFPNKNMSVGYITAIQDVKKSLGCVKKYG